jgi:D-amino peptidase
LRIYISADGEGITGLVNSAEMYPGQPEYEFGREMMTGDVNAAIAGAFDGGATDVLVNDSHWSMRNLLPLKLDPRAQLIRGFNKHLAMVEQIAGADGAFFIGYHARVGDSDSVANETILGREMIEVRMNGRPVGEGDINAALAGHFGVPVLLASGDDILKAQLTETLPDVEFAVTKYAIDRWTARCLSPEESWSRIREAAARAVQKAGQVRPFRVEGPVEFEVEFVSTASAHLASLIPGVERPRPRVAAYRGADVIEAWRGLFAMILLGSTAADAIYG